MIKQLTLKILSIFDFFHQRKIIKFLHNKNYCYFKVLFDVGAHKGESIELYMKNFKVDAIYSFEASPSTFKVLLSKISSFKKNFKDSKFIIENNAIGASTKKVLLKQVTESSSSTIRDLNVQSKYFKKKLFFLKDNKSNNFFKETEVEQIKLNDYVNRNNITSIDFLKIDTEGYEFDVLLGSKDILPKINLILFEHHYDDMIKKNYTFSNIHELLKTNDFEQIYKIKMPFRKTFEYIYINKKAKID